MGNCNFSDLALDKANDHFCQQDLKTSRTPKQLSMKLSWNRSFPDLPDLPM